MAESNVLKTYGCEADGHWREVMEIAERYGFIIQAYGGVAMLATHKNQIEQYGEVRYLRTQKMNGHCPKDCGYESCGTDSGEVSACGSCYTRIRGPKWKGFEKNPSY